jgi:hypothetical protein
LYNQKQPISSQSEITRLPVTYFRTHQRIKPKKTPDDVALSIGGGGAYSSVLVSSQ